MTKNDLVTAHLNHQETDKIPYHLPIVGRNKEPHYAILDSHFGSRDALFGQLDDAIKGVGGADLHPTLRTSEWMHCLRGNEEMCGCAWEVRPVQYPPLPY